MSEAKSDHTSTAASTMYDDAFRAILTPHRSLSASGFLILMCSIGAISFCVGVAFLLMGAWPVFGFFGLDVALIFWAFKRNYRDGNASEHIEVTPHTVQLTRTDAAGRQSVVDFNTYWVRLKLDERSDGRSHLNLISRGQKTLIADFLSDHERREFAEILAAELQAARSRTAF